MDLESRALPILSISMPSLCPHYLKPLPIPVEGMMTLFWLEVGHKKKQDLDRVERMYVCSYMTVMRESVACMIRDVSARIKVLLITKRNIAIFGEKTGYKK